MDRRGYIGLLGAVATIPAMAAYATSGKSCGPGEQSVSGIEDDDIDNSVRLRGEVVSTYRDSNTDYRWFNVEEPSGIALVLPAEGRESAVDELREGDCVTVVGRVEEIYQGEYTTCVDPVDSTCPFLSQDVKIRDATWDTA